MRARRKVRADEMSQRPSRAEQLAVADDFVAAILAGDEARVRELLTPDAVMTSDGGANRHAARRAVVGPQRIGRFVVNIAKRWMNIDDHEVSVQSITVNGSPGIVFNVDGRPYWVTAMDVRDGKVDRVYAILNPAKLKALRIATELV